MLASHFADLGELEQVLNEGWLWYEFYLVMLELEETQLVVGVAAPRVDHLFILAHAAKVRDHGGGCSVAGCANGDRVVRAAVDVGHLYVE